MRLQRALYAVVLVALAGGCTSDEKEPSFSDPARSSAAAPVGSAPAWTEPAAYSYVLTRGCDPAAPLGTYRATVSGGAVSAAERVGAPAASPSSSAEVDLGPVTGQEGEEIEVPTLAQLVTMAQTAAEDGAEVATEYDAADGHPVKVSINVTDGPDGAECWTISDYQP
ncbi:hypothetical protein AB0F72_37375 [Actinoplanes sp. NPDC023936]|uniref:hypothetical protein n=1 Tax=Actinoplanes sp. NPDC023936 TaxID=3154910 RepID=UPI0033F2C471